MTLTLDAFVTSTVLVPEFDGAVVRRRGHHGPTVGAGRQEHTAGRGLEVTAVLHHLTTWLP